MTRWPEFLPGKLEKVSLSSGCNHLHEAGDEIGISPTKGDLIMNMRKVTDQSVNGKDGMLVGFEHYVALDWSKQTMAIGHMSPRSQHPKVFEQEANLAALKEYLTSLRGRTVLVIEETTTAQWLYVELRDSVARIIICDPYRNRLLSDGPKTDKV